MRSKQKASERRISREMLGRIFDCGSSTFPQVALDPSLLDNMIGIANNWLEQAERRSNKRTQIARARNLIERLLWESSALVYAAEGTGVCNNMRDGESFDECEARLLERANRLYRRSRMVEGILNRLKKGE